MRERVRDAGRIVHMLDMAKLIESEKVSYTLDEISNDSIVFYGLSKMIEIIGEAAYMISPSFKENHPQLPWRQMEGMRHILVHGYYTISADVLWDVIHNDIPALIPQLESYISELSDNQ